MVIKHSKATKLFAAVLAILMVLAVTPATAFAATRKVTVKASKWTLSASTIEKKAAVVKKGTSRLTCPKGDGWIMFTAPASKTYTFTFSNFKSVKQPSVLCTFGVMQRRSSYPSKVSYRMVKTQGGKSDFLRVNVDNNDWSSIEKKVNRYLNKRSAKIFLKRGQKIYFYCNSSNKIKGTLTIK